MPSRDPSTELRIDSAAECIWRNGEKVGVPPKAFLVLRLPRAELAPAEVRRHTHRNTPIRHRANDQPTNLAAQRLDQLIPDGTSQTSLNPASGGPGVRRFKAGDLLTYSYLIYGERRPSATGAPNLWSQIRLFRAGKEVFTGKETPVTTSQRSSGGGIVAIDSFRLGERLEPGEYFLQVVVIDKLAPAQKQLSDQWLDFEIVK